ncbi:hypothetical protein CFP65_4399 [Kitasatospora sp. MMS16-BH015]|uniref:hypothetical protein n=1 Tax=Kitasatospora sp. MMS16-BH015 TaxID=2018025 RepID=UPI000CA2F202|nr:hypothetical protein [Kitasatospora sp. MMS16-BH015]AUG79148.1 hypothetical protein CFP65_4399 [Kitasatospora sp. MMS16-BH015]
MKTSTTEPGAAFVRAGGIVFGLGSVATLVTFVPLFFHLKPLPTAAYWLCMLMPLGFLLSLVGLLQGARAQKHRAEEGSGAA